MIKIDNLFVMLVMIFLFEKITNNNFWKSSKITIYFQIYENQHCENQFNLFLKKIDTMFQCINQNLL